MNYLIYYHDKIDGIFRIWNSESNLITSNINIPFDTKRYHVFKGYDANDEGLIKFVNDFKNWYNEIRYNDILKIEYTKYYSHACVVENTFKRLTPKHLYESHEQIKFEENEWFNACHCGGLTFCDAGTYDCYGYDFKSQYPNILNSDDFKIPTKAGIPTFIKKLPKSKSLIMGSGIYRVDIQCSDNNFKKIFAFSKSNTYVDIYLKFALKHQKQFDVKIELIIDDEPNAYLYDVDSIINTRPIFDNWFNKLNELKSKFPKNKLVKHLSSSLWGSLTMKKKLNKTPQQIIDEKLEIDFFDAEYIIKAHHIYEHKEYYELQNKDNPYHYQMRIKPYLTAYSRIITAKVALLDLENVVRIQTDNVCFKKEQTFNIENLVSEDKTTGLIEFKNCNVYKKL